MVDSVTKQSRAWDEGTDVITAGTSVLRVDREIVKFMWFMKLLKNPRENEGKVKSLFMNKYEWMY